MALSYKNDNQEDDRLNPAERAKSLQDREQQSGSDQDSGKTGSSGDTTNKNIDDTKDREQNSGLGGWKDNFSSGGSGGKSKFNLKTSLKKKGPLGALIALFGGGTIGLGMFFGGPGLLIVNFAEILTDRFNYQFSSMDVRTNRMMKSKTSSTTSGLCTNSVSLRCKYSTLNNRQINKFQQAGITVNYEDTTSVRNRAKPTSFTFNGQTVQANNFNSTMRNNVQFRAAVHQAYSPKFAGFADRIFGKAAAKLRISKKAALAEANTDAERASTIRQQVASGQTGNMRVVNLGDNKDPTCSGDDCAVFGNQEEVDRHNKTAERVNSGSADGSKAGRESINQTSTAVSQGTGAVTNLIRITGPADTACMAFGLVNSVSNGAKMIRALQMASYAMIFLNTASMIKAGDANPGDVNYLGNQLTKTSADSDDHKTATDSYGYKYAAYGDSGTPTDSATMFMSGGGFGGVLAGATSAVMSMLGSRESARTTCGILGNPFVQVGTLVAGIGVMLIPGVGQAFSVTRLAAQGGVTLALAGALIVLPNILADIVAGNLIDDNTDGEESGDAITSGSAAMMGTVASTGGNAPLTPNQAVAYSNLQQETIAKHEQEERLNYSPLDPYSNSTFMGKLFGKLAPYHSSLSSISGIMSTSMSIVGSSLSNIFSPYTKAATAADFNTCEDMDYQAVNLATDPLCNPVYGIPPEYLNSTPIEVADRLGDEIDQDTGDPVSDDYIEFVEQCIDRELPIGSGDDTFRNDGSNCFIRGDNAQKRADYYVHYIDLRVLDGMEEGISTT